MAITDQLTAITQADVLPFISGLIQTPSPTLTQLLMTQDRVIGAAGDGTRITVEVERPDGRFYSGFDTRPELSAASPNQAFFALWYNGQWDISLAGTYLEENMGVSSRRLMADGASLQGFTASEQKQLFNYLLTQARSAASAGKYDMSRALWGNTDANDNTARMPETLVDLMDETGSFHGNATTAFGTFDTTDPWGASAPGQASLNIWEPRIFDNSGTPRNIASSVIGGPLREMSARFPGKRIGPLHPTLYDRLVRDELEANIRIPIDLQQANLNIAGFTYENCFMYPDPWAPTDRMKVIHVGDEVMRGTFFVRFWVDEEVSVDSFDIESEIDIPFYMQEYRRGGRSADAIGTDLQSKFTFICTNRAAQAEIRDLQ